MAKSIFAYISVIVAAFISVASINAQTTPDFTVDGLQYRILSNDPPSVSVLGLESGTTIPDDFLKIPNTVSYNDVAYDIVDIAANAFVGGSFKNLTISDKCVTIGDKAFSGSLIVYLYIPESVLSLGKSAFENCVLLREIRNGGMSLATIPERAFAGCKALTALTIGPNYYSNPGSTIQYPINNSLGPLITSIGANAFLNCSNLQVVTLPNSVQDIYPNAFSGCSNLRRVVFGNSMQSISTNSFAQCPLLKEVIIKATDYVSNNKAGISGATIYVNEDLIESYRSDDVTTNGWANTGNTFDTIVPLKLTLTLDNEPLGTSLPLSLLEKVHIMASLVGQEFLGDYASSHQTVMSWNSSNPDVLAVKDNQGHLEALAKGTSTVTVSTTFDYETFTKSFEVFVDMAKPTSVVVKSPTSDPDDYNNNKLPDLSLGSTMQLTAKVLPAGAPQQVTWSCSTPNIASIDQNGVITPKGIGRATFYATSVADPSIISKPTPIELHYAKATSIDVTYDADTLRIDDTAQLKLQVNPYPYASQAVMWFSTNDSIATVSQTGFVECKGLGKVVIQAMATNDTHIVGKKEFYIDYSLPTSMTITSGNLDMKIGDVRQIQFVITPKGAEQRAEWVSEHDSIATVDGDGNVKAIGVGTTVITGTTKDISASITVNVDYADPQRVYINFSGVNVFEGDSIQLKARVLPAGAKQDIVWSVDEDSIATINQDGWVFGLLKGATHVVAKAVANPTVFEGCNVIVMEPDTEAGWDAIDDISADRVTTQISGATLYITGLEAAETVEIFDLTGTCVFRTSAPLSGEVSTGTLRRGIYIVRVGKYSAKVKI